MPEVSPIYQAVQAAAWIAAVITAAVATWRGVVEIRANRNLREQELLWKQMKAAADILDAIENDTLAELATNMLDYEGRTYKLPSGKKFTVDNDSMYEALKEKEEDEEYSDSQVHIRDCFDHFFYYLNRLGLYVRMGLIRSHDIEFPVRYWSDCMANNKPVFAAFMTTYHYKLAHELVLQFWNSSALRAEDQVDGEGSRTERAASVN